MLPFQKSAPLDPPIRLLVAQIKMVAPLTSPTDLKTFDKKLTPDEEPALLTQLIEDVEVSAQRLFIDHLAHQERPEKTLRIIPLKTKNERKFN